MKKIFFLVLAVLPIIAFGEDVAPVTLDDIMKFIGAIGGLKGLGALGIAAVAVQGLILVFRSQFIKLSGNAKLLVVTGLTLISGVLSLMLTGLDLPAALLHSTTLAAVQVFLNQIYKEFLAPAQV